MAAHVSGRAAQPEHSDKGHSDYTAVDVIQANEAPEGSHASVSAQFLGASHLVAQALDALGLPGGVLLFLIFPSLHELRHVVLIQRWLLGRPDGLRLDAQRLQHSLWCLGLPH